MAIGQSNKPNFNVQTPVANQSLVYDNAQQAFVNANISSSGSVTGASNVGSGSGVFKQLSGTDLQFRSLVAGTNISLAQSTDSVTITANGVVTTAENLGSGTGLFAQLNSGTGKVQFKGLVAGTGIALANNSTDVTVSINAASVDAATLGGNAASVFLTKADNLASIGSITTTRTNLSVYSKAEGDSRYFKQGADLLPDADNTRSLGSNSNRFSDVYAKDIHGTVTTAGQVTTISNHNIGGLGDVDTTGVTSNSILKWNGTKWAIAVDAGGITTLNALTDVDTTGAVNSSVLKYNASSNVWEVGSDIGGGGGASTFVGLTDTPNNFVGAGSKFVKVNSGSSALEYVTVDSDDIAEGSNLYYTNARADARIGAASLSALSNVHTAAPTDGQVLKWDNGNSRWAPANDTDTVYSTFNSDFDTRLGSKNTDNLSEGSSNLYYTDARWDNRLSAKSTTNLTEGSNLYYTDARVNARVSALGSANWNTAYGWGNHASAGYLTSVPAQSFASLTGKPTTIAGYGITNLNASIDTHLNQSNPTSGYVLSWNGSDYAWVSNAGGGGGDITAVVAGTGLTGGATSGSATLNVDVGTGANKIVQLDGSAKIPAVDGSLLTNINYTVGVDEIKDTMIDFGTSTGQVSTADIPESTNLYYTDGRFDTRLASKSTTNLSEGTNLYFTNARADARISAAGINALSDVDTTGIANDKILKYNSSSSKWVIADDSTGGGGSANFTGLSDTPANFSGGANKFVKVNAAGNALEYVADPGYLTSVPAQSFASLTGKPTTIAGYGITDALALGTSATTALAGNTTFSFASLTGKPTTIAGYGITDAYDDSDFDTRLASKNTANLTEGTNLYFTNARADARITNAGVTGAKVTNWDTAYSWGNHASAGYLSSETFTSLVQDTTPQLGGTLDANGKTIDMGTNILTDANLGQFITAYGWGNHASAGYLTSVPAQTFASLTSKPTTLAGYGITDGYANTDVDAHINQSNPTSGHVLSWNGSDYAWVAQSGGGGSVAGTNTQVQFNDGGSFGADSGLTFNKSTDTLTAGTFTTSGSSPKLSSTAALTLESGSNNDITITPNGSGDIILDGQKWPQADGSTGQYLKTDGSGQLSWSSVTSGPADTDALSEGSSNLYHTTARAISAIQGTNINMGSNSITTTGKVLYSNVYSALVDLPSASTYHGMFAHVHATGKGYFAHGGNWIELANHSQLANSSNWDTAFGWGNHASAGYLTSVPAQTFASLTSKPTTLAGYGISDGYTDAKADLRITNAIKDEDNMASNSATHVPSQQSVKAYVDAQSGGTAYEEFKINYATNGTISSISDTTSNITSVNIDSAAGGDLTVNFQNFTTPPLSTMFYGYNYAANEYNMNTLGSTGTTLRKVPGGGSSGSPTAFGSFSNLKIRV